MYATGSQEQSSDRRTNKSRRGGVCTRHEGGIPRQPAMKMKDVQIKQNGRCAMHGGLKTVKKRGMDISSYDRCRRVNVTSARYFISN